MSESMLSPDEVQALLQGIAGEPVAPAAPPEARGCDLASQERAVSGEMPGLARIHERYASHLHAGLLDFAHKAPQIAAGAIRVQKYADFLREAGAPSTYGVATLAPLRGAGLVVCDAPLVCAVVDALFGGGGKFPSRVEGRGFSPTERRIAARIAEVALAAYRKAWSPVYPLAPELARSEVEPQFAAIAQPGDPVVCAAFTVGVAGASGVLRLCWPYAALEPIRDALYAPAAAEAPGTDAAWAALLMQQLQSADVELVAELARVTATVEQLLTLEAGDFLELDLGQSVRALVDGVPVFDCHYGTSGGKNAIRIDPPAAARPDSRGEPHV